MISSALKLVLLLAILLLAAVAPWRKARAEQTITPPFYVVCRDATGIIFSGCVSSVTSVMPKCDDGWTLVLNYAMHPMCARELKEPQQ